METISVERQSDGSVVCKGRIVSGASVFTNNNVGFCAGFDPGAPWSQNEKRTDIASDQTFTVTYAPGDLSYGLNGYYYRAFGLYAGPNGGTADVYGADMQPTAPAAETPPCDPAVNSYLLMGYTPGSGTFYLVDGPGSMSDNYKVTARLYTSTLEFNIRFGASPETGLYTTHQTLPNFAQPHDISISFSMGPGTTSHAVASGQTVYVERISPTVVNIVMCSLAWGDGVGKQLTMRLRTGQ